MNSEHRVARVFIVLVMMIGAAALAQGCASYTLRGKAIAGEISYIAIVDADDERLNGPGIEGASITLETDPGRLRRERVGDAVSGSDGSFSIPVQRPGAGVLIYDVGLEARRPGYDGARQDFRLPPSNKRVLVILKPGPNTLPDREESLMEQYERFRQRD